METGGGAGSVNADAHGNDEEIGLGFASRIGRTKDGREIRAALDLLER